MDRVRRQGISTNQRRRLREFHTKIRRHWEDVVSSEADKEVIDSHSDQTYRRWMQTIAILRKQKSYCSENPELFEPSTKVTTKPKENVRWAQYDFMMDLNTLIEATTRNRDLIATLMGLQRKKYELPLYYERRERQYNWPYSDGQNYLFVSIKIWKKTH